ncbi:MAG: DsbA family protein [Acidobacteria bacterium]|nr:DsbA family protein [Acidobacteriota bacterium]
MRRNNIFALCLVGIFLTGGLPAQSAGPVPVETPVPTPEPKVPQDPVVLQFVQRALPWYPDSSFKIVKDERHQTASGSYRFIGVRRECANKFLSVGTAWVVDEVAGVVWNGSVGRIPPDQLQQAEGLKEFVSRFLPVALMRAMRLRVKVVWDGVTKPSGALIPFELEIQSGYGTYRKPGAVTSDGALVILGTSFPWKEDPVEYRRKLLHGSELVLWDHDPKGAKIDLVEFSDFECPGCKAKWPLIHEAVETFSGVIRHGMVNYPLTQIHPWAFRAASVGWCVARQNPDLLIPLKEQFYSMQGEMAVSTVGDFGKDFAAGHGLDEAAFDACYLKPPSIDAIHRQLTLAQELNVMATPTYFVNGWQIQVPTKEWLFPFLERLAAGKQP